MLFRTAQRMLFLMVLAMGVSLFTPGGSWNEATSRTEVPATEEEPVAGHGVLSTHEVQAIWHLAALHGAQACALQNTGHQQVLPKDPVREVAVPPPEPCVLLS